jgi:hypothetical protein
VADDVRRLHEILQSGALAALGREAERRRDSTAAIRRHLPTDLAAHLVSAVRDAEGVLVLVMDSPSWAARARYSAADLGEERVVVKVLPLGGA